MIALLIYVLSIVDKLKIFSIGVIGIGFVVSIFLFGFGFFGSDCEIEKKVRKNLRKWFKRCMVIISICIALVIFVPDSKVIVAMYLVPKIVHSKVVKKAVDLPEKFVDILNIKLKEYIDNYKKPKGRGK